MTTMKKQKRGRCKFFQTLAGAFRKKKKLNVVDDDGIPEPPFSSLHDIPEEATAEKDPARQGTSQDKVPTKAHQKPPREVPVKAAKAISIDLDKVQREAGLVNSELVKDRLKIRPSKRAPRKYAERLEQRNDRKPEIPVAVDSEKNKSTENLQIVSNQNGKDSVTPKGDGQATEGNANNEKSNKAPSVAQKQRNDATEGKEAFRRQPSEKKSGKKLPRVDATEAKPEQAVDPDIKTMGAVNQLGSGDSFERKGSTKKAVESIRLEAEIASSGFGNSETAKEGLSQSMTASGRKLPRTLLDAGENESGALLAAPFADEGDSGPTSTAKLYASGSSLNAPEPGLRDSRRRSSKGTKAESTAKHLGIGEDHTKLNDSKLRSSGRGSTKIRVNSKEIDAESEVKAGKIRESSRKKKDGKKERNSIVDVTNNTSAESGGAPKVESRPIEPASETIGTDINQNENHSLSLKKNHLPDTTGVCHNGEVIPSGVKEKDLKEALVGEVAGDGSLTSKGDVKPAKDMGIPEIAVHGDPSVAKRAGSRKSLRVEPLGTKALASASHSRDASIDSAGNSTLESSEGEKTSDGTKAALLPSSSESLSAIGEIGRSSFKASGDGDENEFNKAFKKIRTKQTTSSAVAVDDAPSRNSVRLLSKQQNNSDGVAPTLPEKEIPECGSLKAKENLSENQVDALGKSLRGSGRKAGGDSRPAENHLAVGEDKKPGPVTAEADALSADGDDGGSSLDKRKVPPAPPAVKRSVKVQPKPAEGGKEVVWASMARRMSREFGDKKLQTFEAKNDEEKQDHDIEGEGNFERGGDRASVKELAKKFQQKKLNS